MNIENLRIYVGEKVKDYPEMCRILDEDIKNGGNSKPAQLANWSRYFKYEMEKNKFIINEIYDEPLPDKDGRRNGNNSKYVKLIEIIMVSYLVKRYEKSDALSQIRWLAMLGMVNASFSNDESNRKLLENANQYSLNQLYLTANEKLHDILISALDNMKKRKIVDWKVKVTIVPVSGDEYIASKLELDLIKEVEELALKELDCANMFDVSRKGIRKRYYSKCNDLVEKNYQWAKYYKQIYIELIDHDTIDVWAEQIHEIKMELNSQVVNGITRAIKSKVKCAEKKFEYWEDNWLSEYLDASMEDGDCCIPDKPFKYEENFYEVQTDLLNKIVKLQNIENNNSATSDNEIDWDSFINLDN